MSNKEKVDQEVKDWKKIATVGAFSGLALLGFSYWIGTDTVYECVMVLVTTVFFVGAVIWWYWALSKIAMFSTYMSKLSDTLNELSKSIKDIRKDL